jgi:hypothetical protein
MPIGNRASSVAAISGGKCAPQHGFDHRRRQLAGERVLLARVKAAEQREAATVRLGAVPELRERSRGDHVPGELAEADDHAHLGQQRELAVEPGAAVVALGRQRLVGRWRAAHAGGDEAVAQREPVVA